MLFQAGVTDVKVFAACASVLYTKFLAATMIQGRLAFQAGTRLAEDNQLSPAQGQPTQGQNPYRKVDDANVKAAIEKEQRWRRITLNDLESIPMALAVFWGGIAAKADPRVTSGLLLTYTATRLVHTFSFALGLPRARMLSWYAGISCIFAGGVTAVLAALS